MFARLLRVRPEQGGVVASPLARQLWMALQTIVTHHEVRFAVSCRETRTKIISQPRLQMSRGLLQGGRRKWTGGRELNPSWLPGSAPAGLEPLAKLA